MMNAAMGLNMENCRGLRALLLGILLMFWALDVSGQDPPGKLPIQISVNTTHITEPRMKNGLVDYAGYLNRIMSAGVSAEKNAVVLYWEVIGNSSEVADNPAYLENLSTALGVKTTNVEGPSLVDYLAVYELETGTKASYQDDRPWNELEAALERPWAATEFPIVKSWLDRNAESLKKINAATEREQYFRPLVRVKPDQPLVTMLLPEVSAYRNMARLYCARVMLSLHEGETGAAVNDLITIHRLARHSMQGATVIELLIGIAIDHMADSAAQQLVQSPHVTPDQLNLYFRELNRLKAEVRTDFCLQSERLMNLDTVQRLVSAERAESGEHAAILAMIGLPEDSGEILTSVIGNDLDWNPVMVGINVFHDELQAALKLPGYVRQRDALQSSIDKLEISSKDFSTPEAVARLGKATAAERGKVLGDVLLSFFVPALSSVHEAATRGSADALLVRLGVAVAAEHKRNGDFPESLDALVPRYFSELPLDPYTGKPFIYRVDGESAVIFSLGANLKDDGGQTREEDRDNYDLVFRVSPAVQK